MRYLLLTAILILSYGSLLQVTAQEEGNQSGIALNIIVPDLGDDFRSNDESTLETRLQQLVSNYGTGGSNFNPNFVLVPDVIIDDYETMGGAPPRTLAKLEIILKIANAESQTIFSSASIRTSGVGDNKKEAISEAIKKMDTRSDELEKMVKNAKEEIVAYYNAQCENILKKAKAHAEAEKFGAAFSYLYRIPAEAECYEEAMNRVEPLFNEYQRVKCSKLLSAAEAAYGAGDLELAAQKLALIPSSSDCSQKASELADEMKEERIMKYKTEAEIEKLKVESAREIALAFARNQPDKVVDIRFLTDD